MNGETKTQQFFKQGKGESDAKQIFFVRNIWILQNLLLNKSTQTVQLWVPILLSKTTYNFSYGGEDIWGKYYNLGWGLNKTWLSWWGESRKS